MKKLNDTELILLSTAAGRDDGSLVPLRATLNASADRIHKAIAAVLKAAYAEENEVRDAAKAWRQQGASNVGVRITEAGRAAIGVSNDNSNPDTKSPDESMVVTPTKKQTKTAMVLGLLRREEGATLAELVMATGWLPHTTRAALTGLRKRHHKIEKGKRGEETLYRIASAA